MARRMAESLQQPATITTMAQMVMTVLPVSVSVLFFYCFLKSFYFVSVVSYVAFCHTTKNMSVSFLISYIQHTVSMANVCATLREELFDSMAGWLSSNKAIVESKTNNSSVLATDEDNLLHVKMLASVERIQLSNIGKSPTVLESPNQEFLFYFPLPFTIPERKFMFSPHRIYV